MVPAGNPDAEALAEWGYLLGLWHDLGKFTPEWQAYLRRKAGCDLEGDEASGSEDHSTAGGQLAIRNNPLLGHLLAFAILGHHAGLPDAGDGRAASGASGTLGERLQKAIRDYSCAPSCLLTRPVPALPRFVSDRLRSGSTPAFFTRMLFSCLVDADFLATESFMAPVRARLRVAGDGDILRQMEVLLMARINAFGEPGSIVARARRDVYESCLEMAEKTPGLFSLTVPTGGGKTLSSLAFALRHAIRHGQQRIIYVIPFTSIIEQNAAIFADLFEPLVASGSGPVVIEHHSNLSPEKETTQSRLATENWDAPLVVTTAVQFYESLHAARTSQCRKLHHIANSVVILDEAQCLPVDYLKPCLESLRELSGNYRASIVLCTATQPAIARSDAFPIGLEQVREIIPDSRKLFETLKRVKVIDRDILPDNLLASELAALPQALVIVNTRFHAQNLFRQLPPSGENFHLSALMCPAHRREVLETVRQRLEDGLPVRLVSTQLIEAGVDVDFPIVYRARAGLDSIAQAAGRCNRNGRLSGLGEVHLFRSEHQRAEAYFRDTANVASQVLACYEDPLGLAAVEHFFRLYYHQHRPSDGPQWDTKNISKDYELAQNRSLPFMFQFRSTAERFRLIENEQVSILIPYGELARERIAELRNESVPLHRALLRDLQRYAVQIHRPAFNRNVAQFESIREGQFHILVCPETHYSAAFGLHLGNDNLAPLIC